MATEPKVSVSIVCYNQESYIAQSLDSVLMQRTSFDYDIVVGDDCSTDGTRQVIQDYQRRHPGKVRPIFHERNVGTARNVKRTYEACHGQYIALLAGDDYWTDPEKLQMQVDFLDRNLDCAFCHHRVNYVLWPDGVKIREFPPAYYRAPRSDPRLLPRFNYIQALSVVLRRECLPALDEQFQELTIEDWPLVVLLAQRGAIGYLDRTMADYRVHASNNWANRPSDYKIRAMEKMAVYLLERVDERSKDAWRDTLLALAFKDFAMAVKSLSPGKSLNRLRYFAGQSAKYRKPFWVFNRLWPYYRANSRK